MSNPVNAPAGSRTAEDDETPPESDEYHVPTAASPVHCPYCGAPFADTDLRALHWGLEHRERLSAGQRTAVERAQKRERAAARRFRLVTVGLLALLYFALMMTYAVVT